MMLRGEQFTGVEFVSDSDARAIEVHVANLRRKLGESPAQSALDRDRARRRLPTDRLTRRMPRHAGYSASPTSTDVSTFVAARLAASRATLDEGLGVVAASCR